MSETPPEVVYAEIVEADDRDRRSRLGVELPENPEDAVEYLLEKLEESRDEATTYLDDLKRVAADFDNYRKRTVREQSAMVDRAAERVVRELLPVLDSLDAAVAFEASNDAERKLLTGMINTRELLLAALAKEGLDVIDTVGAAFDPGVHEAVGPAVGDGSPIVGAELRRGYRLGGRVLRPALVTLEGAG